MDPQELIDAILTGGYGDYGSEPGDRFYRNKEEYMKHKGGRIPHPSTNPDAYDRWRHLPFYSDLARQGIPVPPSGYSMDLTQDMIDKLLRQPQQEQDLDKVPMY